jgi:Ala-tRNA(Pro) deacylase
MSGDPQVFAALIDLGIKYDVAEHPPAHTIEDCKVAEIALDAVMPKNYFLTTRNHSAYVLLITRPNARLRTADISKQLGLSRLSFAGEADAAKYLGTYPGAITPLGLIYDTEKIVRVAIDDGLVSAKRLAFHPCDNSTSVGMSAWDFFDVWLKRYCDCKQTEVLIDDWIG